MATEAGSTTQSQTKQVIKEETKQQESRGEGSREREVRVESRQDAVTVESVARIKRGEEIIRHNVLWALGVGLLPLPLLDIIGITAVEVKMIRELSQLYRERKFSSDIAQKLVTALLASLGSVALGGMLGASLAKFIPYVGSTLGIIAVPVTAGAFTHAVGKVFLMHFESGGTVLDFDANAMRDHFRTEFEKAKETVVKIKQEEELKASTKTNS